LDVFGFLAEGDAGVVELDEVDEGEKGCEFALDGSLNLEFHEGLVGLH
jgi:hypothetical protein